MGSIYRDMDRRVSGKPHSGSLPLNYEPNHLTQVCRDFPKLKRGHLSNQQNRSDSDDSSDSDNSDESNDSRNIYSPGEQHSRYAQPIRSPESDMRALSRIQQMQNNAKPPTCMDFCLSCLGLISIDAKMSKKYARDLILSQISLRINNIYVNGQRTCYDILGPLNNSRRRWRLLLLTLKVAAAFRMRARNVRFVLGPFQNYRQALYLKQRKTPHSFSRGWAVWCCVVHLFVCLLWIAAPLHSFAVNMQDDPIYMPSIYVLCAVDVIFLLCAMEALKKACCYRCQCCCTKQVATTKPWLSNISFQYVLPVVIAGVVPINVVQALAAETVQLYANRQDSAFVRGAADGSLTLSINVIRGLLLGIPHYSIRFLNAVGNRHSAASRSTTLFWTRDVALLCILYHWCVSLMLLSGDSQSIAPVHATVAYLNVLMADNTAGAGQTWRGFSFTISTTLLLLVLTVRSILWTLSQDNAHHVASIHRWIKTYKYATMAHDVRAWWDSALKKGEMNDATLSTASGSHIQMLCLMPPSLRRKCEQYTWSRHLQKLDFLKPWTKISSSITSLNELTSRELRYRLAKSMYTTSFSANDTIIEKNELVRSLRFLLQGRLSIGEQVQRNTFGDKRDPTCTTDLKAARRKRLMNVLEGVYRIEHKTTSSVISHPCWFGWSALGYCAGGLPFPANNSLVALDFNTVVLHLDGDVLFHTLFVLCPDVLDALRVDVARWQQMGDGRHHWKDTAHESSSDSDDDDTSDNNHHASLLPEDKEAKRTKEFRLFRKYYERNRERKKEKSNIVHEEEDQLKEQEGEQEGEQEERQELENQEKQEKQEKQKKKPSAPIDVVHQQLTLEKETRATSAAHDARIREWPSSEPIVRVKLDGPTIASHLKNRTGTRGEWVEKAGRYNIILDGKSKGRAPVQVRVLPHDIILLSPTMKEKPTMEPMELPDIYYAKKQDETVIQIHRGSGHVETRDNRIDTPSTPETNAATEYRRKMDREEINSEDEFDALPSNTLPPSRGLLKTFLDDPDSAAVNYESAARKNDHVLPRTDSDLSTADSIDGILNSEVNRDEDEEGNPSNTDDLSLEFVYQQEIQSHREYDGEEEENNTNQSAATEMPLSLTEEHEVEELLPVEKVVMKKDPLNLLNNKKRQSPKQSPPKKILLKKDPLNLLKKPNPKQSPPKQNELKNDTFHLDLLTTKQSETKTESVVTKVEKIEPKPKEMRTLLRILHAFPGMEDGDLPLQKGGLVWGVERRGDWWFGQIYSSKLPSSKEGGKGLFPGNYVEAVEKSNQSIEQVAI